MSNKYKIDDSDTEVDEMNIINNDNDVASDIDVVVVAS